MSPHGIAPFAGGQHRINALYGKVSSVHQRSPPVKYLDPRMEGKTGPKLIKIAGDPLSCVGCWLRGQAVEHWSLADVLSQFRCPALDL